MNYALCFPDDDGFVSGFSNSLCAATIVFSPEEAKTFTTQNDAELWAEHYLRAYKGWVVITL